MRRLRRFYRDRKILVETAVLLGLLFVLLAGFLFLFGDWVLNRYEDSMVRKFIRETHWGEGERWSWSELLDGGLGGSPHRGRRFRSPEETDEER